MDFFLNRRRKRRQKSIREKKEHNEKLIRDLRTLFEQEKDYYKSERASNFWNDNYIDFESNGDKNRNLWLVEYLNKIKPYLRNIIIDLQNSDTWKNPLTIAINLISLKNAKEERLMHSRNNNIKFTLYSVSNELLMNYLSHFVQNIKKI